MKLSTTYSTVQGDTFSTVARKTLGDDTFAYDIQSTNPGITEPFEPGTKLKIPDVLSGIEDDIKQNDEIKITVEGTELKFWNLMVLARSVDAISRLTLAAPDDFRGNFEDFFVPFKYETVRLTIGGRLMFTGVVQTPNENTQINRKSLTLEFYGFPNVLSECPAPASLFPLEFKKLDLRQIAQRFVAPFGRELIFLEDPGKPFDKTEYKPGTNILKYLTTLAQQRGLVITDDVNGSLVFQKSVATGSPIARIREGQSPFVNIKSTYNRSVYFSEITSRLQAKAGRKSTTHTITNPFLTTQTRPFEHTVKDIDGGDIETATEAKLGRMLGNCAKYQLSMSTWRDATNNLFFPNTTAEIEAPTVKINEPYEFLLRNVTMLKSPVRKESRVDLVMPGAFSGQTPERLPWQSSQV